MATWTRQPEDENANRDYTFSGRFYVTRGVFDTIPAADVAWIIGEIRRLVKTEGALDYLQVFTSDTGKTVWVIDQLSRTQLTNADYTEEEKKEFNYFTVLFPSEY